MRILNLDLLLLDKIIKKVPRQKNPERGGVAVPNNDDTYYYSKAVEPLLLEDKLYSKFPHG